jgi:GMP synthase PP-ATPase subunit
MCNASVTPVRQSTNPPGLINEVKGVNTVVYDITSKASGAIEWE